MGKTAKLREPDLELSAEASERLAEIAARPHHPSAAAVNFARAEESLRQRKARRQKDQVKQA
jgi:hypothetical protein